MHTTAAPAQPEPGEERPITVGCEVDDSHIDTQHTRRLEPLWRCNRNGRQQVPLAAHQGQVALALREGQQLALAFAADKPDRLAPVKGPERHRGGRQGEGENTRIVGDGTERCKPARAVAVELVGIGNFGKAANGELGSEAERRTNGVIGELVERKLAKGAGLSGQTAELVAGGIGSQERALERIGLR